MNEPNYNEMAFENGSQSVFMFKIISNSTVPRKTSSQDVYKYSSELIEE